MYKLFKVVSGHEVSVSVFESKEDARRYAFRVLADHDWVIRELDNDNCVVYLHFA